jgi:iron complex outermembrane receptor protein
MRYRFKGGTALLALAAMLVSTQAVAQDAQQSEPAAAPPQNVSEGSALLSDIVVTARKREVGERAQDVPIAITAFSEAQYEAVFAQDLQDLGELAPNVEFEGSTIVGLQNFTIRGMGITGSTPSDAPAVGIFQNGVFWGSNYGALIDTFDIESVEILRGPQGTLFGRNVTGGAVLVRTKRPGNKLGFEVEAVVGSHGRKDVAFAVEGPLIEGVLAGRVTALYRSYDGYFDNLESGKPYGASETNLLRGTFVFTPVDALDVTVIGEHYIEEGDSTPVIGIEVPGNLPYANGFRQPEDYWDIRLDRPGLSKIQVDSATVEANLQVGPGALTSISGYRNVFNRNYTDFDGTPFSGFNQSILFKSKQFSQEVRYAADLADWIDFTVGAYYFDLEHQFREGRAINRNASLFASGNHLEQSSKAIFGEVDLKFGQFTVTGGARYTSEKITAETRPFGGCPLRGTTNPLRYLDLTLPCDLGPSDTAKFSDISPKLAINWKPNQNHLLYASAQRGFRSGGFSLRGSALTPPFDAEKVNAFEAGYKGDLLGNRLRLNLAGFYNEYADLQRTIVFQSDTLGSFQKTGNAAHATIKGAEVDVTWQVVEPLVLTASYGYTDASFESFVGLDVTGDGVPDPDLATRLDFVRVPKHTGSASANYNVPFASGAELDFRVSATYASSQYLDDLNRLKEPAYTLVDASVTFSSVDDRFKASLFAKNLTNKDYAFYSANLGAIGLLELGGPPRTYGLRLSYDY